MSLQQQYIIINNTENSDGYYIAQFAGIVQRDRNEVFLYQLTYHLPVMAMEEAIKTVIHLQENHSGPTKSTENNT